MRTILRIWLFMLLIIGMFAVWGGTAIILLVLLDKLPHEALEPIFRYILWFAEIVILIPACVFIPIGMVRDFIID